MPLTFLTFSTTDIKITFQRKIALLPINMASITKHIIYVLKL